MRATEAGLLVVGQVDRDVEEGQRVWKAIKRGSMGFSIGYMATASRPKRPEGKGRLLTEIDLLEVSATVTPMNAGTRTLGWKSLDPDESERSSESSRRAGRRSGTSTSPSMTEAWRPGERRRHALDNQTRTRRIYSS